MKRVFFKANLKQKDDPVNQEREIAPEAEANLVSSLVREGVHAPVLDIDFPARLVESSTPGHFHLYLDRVVSWDDYQMLLWVLWKVGIIEYGFYNLSIKRGASFVRKPGVLKEPDDVKSVWQA